MSDFIAALGGAFVGSVLGFLGSWFIQRYVQKRDEMAAARALFFELVANAGLLRDATVARVLGKEPLRVTRTTWESTQTRVASLLTPKEFLKVAEAYQNAPLWQTYIDEHAADPDASDRETLLRVADSYIKAADILRDRGWPRKDLADFPELHPASQVKPPAVPAPAVRPELSEKLSEEEETPAADSTAP